MEVNQPQRAATRTPITGILIVNKPSGLSSRTVVDRVVGLVARVKVGHAGTLDPLASGILIICVGTAVRLVELLQQPSKSYQTKIFLGARSDTLDADGLIVVEPSARAPSADEVASALDPFVGQILQTPPCYSAKKIRGRRAYHLARAGRPVELAPRMVRIDRITVLSYAWPCLELEIVCGSGTYIRSLAHDLGEALGCGGFVQTLVRTRVGPFTLEDALDAQALSSATIKEHLRPALDALPGMSRVALDAQQLAAISHGQSLSAADLAEPLAASGPVALVDSAGNLAGLAELDAEGKRLHPRKVLI
jgi:tRNA pseudouridine55 synthase